MRILVKEQDSVVSDLAFEREPIHIGSQPGCHIRLPDLRVQLVHAILSPTEDGGWRIEHSDPAARTRINGHVLQESRPIHNGDEITIEDFVLRIYVDFDHARPSEDEAPPLAVGVTFEEEFPLPKGAIVRSRRESLTLTPTQLDDMARFGLRIAGCDDVASLMDLVLAEFLPRFCARAVWIGIRRQPRGALKFIQGRDLHGSVFDTPKLHHTLLNRCLDRGASVCLRDLDDDDTASILASPLALAHGRLGLIYLDARMRTTPFLEKDLDDLIALSASVANQLDLIFDKRTHRRKEVTDAESSIVHAIQAQLEPQHLPEWANFQVAAHCKPGTETAGDIYDVLQMGNGVAAFMVGHVTATPVTSAVTIIEARAAFRVAVLHADLPHVMMQELNWLLCTSPERISMQCAIVLVDPGNGALVNCFAGPSSAMVIGASGTHRPLNSPNTPALGTHADYAYETGRGLLGENETLALYSPGIAKLQDRHGQKMKEQSFLNILCNGFGLAARTALDEILVDLTAFSEGGYQPQDVTILLAHRTQTEPPGN